MKFFLTLLVFLSGYSAFSQYYYTDILTVRKLNMEYQTIKSDGYHTVRLESFEGDDTPSEGFSCVKKISQDYSGSEMLSKSNVTGESLLKATYKDGKIIQSVNETASTTSTTQYTYDANSQLTKISILTSSNTDSSTFSEDRIYTYDVSGIPSTLVRMRNGQQVSQIDFKKDETGNIIEETPESNSKDKKYYYYYDDQNRLTDVVHYNILAKKLLPDFMFAYNDTGQIRQMISVDESGRSYFVWRYSYTSSGLPEIQKCYSKEKKLLGTIQYEYQ